ncbi:pollen-specific leucine-rich repeat extensin-like protein 1 [Tribolium madens]|uniref:pollen-specific leucine-rich repeat extensin-like protein 1 n=1 Tax=Tribolium madens TaxID=41895 RepID=UPI001CF752FD|nr:pollen-specific leucine-rich repeat extensin-like protein 1 [Tribolium madens]
MTISACVTCLLFFITLSSGQLPPRLNIPGAVLVSQGRPAPFRQQRPQNEGPPPRLRRPPPSPNAAPVRPVVEEPEEENVSNNSNFDDEVNKLGISVLQSAVGQAVAQPEEEQPPRPVHFRPERPLPVLRQDIRENVPQTPVLRQNVPRPLLREPQPPVRHTQVRQQAPPQPVRQPPTRGHHPARQPSQYLDEEGGRQRTRKPPVQILRKYRTDNADGSITWGYENEDGTFKEETLGIDCVTRGKYGYIDPDGVRREYSYETGNKCDQPEEDEDLPPERQQIQPRKPQFRPGPGPV